MKIKQSTNILLNVIVFIAIMLSACSGHQHHEHDEERVPGKDSVQAKVGVFEHVDPSLKSQIDGIFKDYVMMTNALTDDHADQAKIEAKKMMKDISNLDPSKLSGKQMEFYQAESTKLSDALTKIVTGKDINSVRLELTSASEAIYALVKTYGANGTVLYYNFCPMANDQKGAYWLSDTKEIINPYMGQQMLTCGITKETINLNH